MKGFRSLVPASVLLILWATSSVPSAQSPSSVTATVVKPLEPGQPFPAGAFGNLNPGAGGAPRINLGDVLGKRPVIFYYWIASNSRSEAVLLELQALAAEFGPTKLVLYGVVNTPPDNPDVGPIRERVQALKLQVPVLLDEGFRIGEQLAIRSVPSINIVDQSGKLRLSNGASLKQALEYKMTLADAIRRVAETGQIGTYGKMPPYYPVVELVGQKSPDFEAVEIASGATRRWSSLLARDKLNILLFWSVTCPHCTKTLPEINAWLKAHPEGINLVSLAAVTNDTLHVKTQEFCKAKGLVFPTLADHEMKVGNLYKVTGTPTVVIVRPDGVVDTVLYSSLDDFGTKFEAKRKELLRL